MPEALSEEEKLERKRALNRLACARYKERHPDRYAAKLVKFRERAKARWEAWDKANPGRKKQIAAEWAKANPERKAETDRKSKAKNRDAIRERSAKYFKENPNYQREWYQKNKERRREQALAWREENRDKWRLYGSKRRALEKGTVDAEHIDRIHRLQNGKCAICRVSFRKTKYEIDHINPISRGGAHENRNLQLLCGPCNRQKWSKDPIEFMQSKGFML